MTPTVNNGYMKRELSHHIRKPTKCIGKTKTQMSCAVTAQLISRNLHGAVAMSLAM